VLLNIPRDETEWYIGALHISNPITWHSNRHSPASVFRSTSLWGTVIGLNLELFVTV